MAWVRFTSDYKYKPNDNVSIYYKEGMILNVTRRCATMAVALDKAIRLTKRSRDAEPVERANGTET